MWTINNKNKQWVGFGPWGHSLLTPNEMLCKKSKLNGGMNLSNCCPIRKESLFDFPVGKLLWDSQHIWHWTSETVVQEKIIQTRLIGPAFEQYLHSHYQINEGYWFFNFESIQCHNIADQVASIGQKIYTVNLDTVKRILWMTEAET